MICLDTNAVIAALKGGPTPFLMSPITIVPFDSDDADEAGDIRATLERAGTPIGPYDILIAAQARRRGARDRHVREFARIPGLIVEDWSAP